MAHNSGVLIRGSDGELYYIPDDKLSTFRLDPQKSAEARAFLDKHGIKSRKHRLPAFRGEKIVPTPPGESCCLIERHKLEELIEDDEKFS
jgi:hypothetical protein